jgi:hypothetical protein
MQKPCPDQQINILFNSKRLTWKQKTTGLKNTQKRQNLGLNLSDLRYCNNRSQHVNNHHLAKSIAVT